MSARASGFARAWQRTGAAAWPQAKPLVRELRARRSEVQARNLRPPVVTVAEGPHAAAVAPVQPALPLGFPDFVAIAGPGGMRFAFGPLGLALSVGSGVALTATDAQALDNFPMSAASQESAQGEPLSPLASGLLVGGFLLVMTTMFVCGFGFIIAAERAARARKEAEARDQAEFDQLWSLVQFHFRGSERPFHISHRGLVCMMRRRIGLDPEADVATIAAQLGGGEDAERYALIESCLLADPDGISTHTGAQMEAMFRSALGLPTESTAPTDAQQAMPSAGHAESR